MRLAPLLILLVACSGAPGSDPTSSDDAITAGQINGGATGAMVRETTPSGFTCISGTWTVPDFDPATKGEPWVYYGIGDEGSIDMEAGLSFQKGDGTEAKPHRWLPYMRKGKAFYFGDESTRALPGDTFVLAARLEHGSVVLEKDGQRLTLSRNGDTIDRLEMSALDPARAHVRRVVGLATAGVYHGDALGTLAPMTFTGSTVCAADGTTRAFHEESGWHETRGGTLYGSVRFPSNLVSHTYDAGADTDVIRLFPR